MTNIDLPSGIVTIGTGAFMKCPLISVALPQGLVSIGDSAFSRCTSLCSVALPDSVLEIDTYAFNGCNQLIMTVVEGSYAYQYAIEQGIFYRYADAGE
ncbi:MAG: leucine-rich repeat domain-containing protein [Clostridiales bacterium]|nr:leucine-rich repeat domain-containing protein [Clostridiales bacterium]